MTIQQENALLRRALLEAAAADFAAEAPEIPQSSRQEKRMRAMLADPFGYAKRVRRPWWRQFVHTAAMVAVALGMSIALLAALSPTVRAAIKAWFMEIRNSDIVYYFTGETKGGKLPYYTITDLPEGYEQTNVVEGPFSRHITYENADGQKLRFSYARMEQGGSHGIETEGMEISNVTVNNCEGQFFRSVDPAYSNGLVWIDEDSSLQFTIDAYADEMVFLHMAESLSLVKTEKR